MKKGSKMAVVRIQDFLDDGNFAGSRESGLKVRTDIERKLVDQKGITLDFAGIDMITQSFGDEILGILTRNKGIDFIKENIRLVNHNDDIREILNYVVKYSQKYFNGEVA